jgi:hypothetical protein
MDVQNQSGTLAPNKAIPLLQQLGRVEELVSAIVMRLDPITNHEPQNELSKQATTNTVTGRLASVGDGLQYLLDHIEL